MSHRLKSPRLRVEALEDRTMPAGSQIPAGEFNWMQYSPTGTLGQLIWDGQMLMYRTLLSSGWHSEAVARSDDFTKFQYNSRDEAQAASQTAQLVYTSDGTAHAFFLEKQYRPATNNYQTFIRHYARGSAGWRMVETIAPPWKTRWGPNNLVAEAGPNNTLHLLFTETTVAATAVGHFGSGNLWYATNKSGKWSYSKVAETTDMTYDVWILGTRYAPRFLSMAVDGQGNAHVTYTPKFYISGAFGTVRSALKYASNSSGSWVSETVVGSDSDSGSADAGLGASIAIAPNGTIAIASYFVKRYETGSPEQSVLLYNVRNTDGTWASYNAAVTPDGYIGEDGPDFTGFAPQLWFDAQSRPTIVFSDEAGAHLPVSYANQYAGQIRTATFVDGSWETSTVFHQTDPITHQLFYPVAATYNGQTVYAGLQAISALDANKNPVRVDFSLVDVNIPGGGTSPPPPPVPPPPPPPVQVIEPVLVTATEAGPTTIVRADYSNGSGYVWTPFGSYFTGGASVARGDVNKDGIDDIIVASGPGITAMVRIWSGSDLKPLGTYYPLGQFGGGLTVASGDVNGDGYADIITGAMRGGLPVVTVISGATGQRINQFLAFGSGYTGGVRLGVGDINHDGLADIAVSTGGGTIGRVRIFGGNSVATGQQPTLLLPTIFAFGPAYRGPLNIALGDLTGDGHADLAVGNGTGAARFRIYDGADLTEGTITVLATQQAWKSDGRGVRLAFFRDGDGDGRADLVLGSQGRRRAARLYSSQFTDEGWPAVTYDWFTPLPSIAAGIYVG